MRRWISLCLTKPSGLRAMDWALGAFWATVLGIGIWGLLESWAFRKREATARLEIASLMAQIQAAERDIERAKTLAEPSAPRGLRAIAPFQSSLQTVATKWGCNLTEFKASSQVQRYVSRFTKDTPETGWVQIEAQAVLRGPAPNLLGALHELAKHGPPHEYNTLELRRTTGTDGEQTQVTATLAFRIVTEPEREGA